MNKSTFNIPLRWRLRSCALTRRVGVGDVTVTDLPIVGIDIAGAERGYPAHTHADAFKYAHKRFLNKTVHAGESYGPESIFEAITDLNAERVGA